MSYGSEFNPVNLILEVSAKSASQITPEEFLQFVTSAILHHTKSDSISITLTDPGAGETFQLTKVATQVRENPDRFRSFVSRDLVVRRVRYGHLELSSANSEFHQGEFLTVLDCLSDQLARYAELHSTRAQSKRLRAQIDQVTEAVKRSKVTARASNFVAAARNLANLAVRPVRTGSRRLYPGLPVSRSASRTGYAVANSQR